MKQKKEFVANGYFCVCNLGGIEVELNYDGEYCRYRWTYGNDKEKVSRWQKVKYAERRGEYFVCHRRRFYFADFLRY